MRPPALRIEGDDSDPRAKLKSCKDDEIIAQGKRSAALGYGDKMIFSFFLPVWRAAAAPNRKKKEEGWVALYPGRQSLRSFALGYCQAAPPGLRNGNPASFTGRGEDARFSFQRSLAPRLTTNVMRVTSRKRLGLLAGLCFPSAV